MIDIFSGLPVFLESAAATATVLCFAWWLHAHLSRSHRDANRRPPAE